MIDEKKNYNYIKEQINPYGKPFTGTVYEFGLKIMDYIENMEKVGEWRPCSERLPEMHREDMEAEGEYYMISNPVIVTDGQQIYIAEYEEDMDYRYGWHSFDGEDYDNIIAWMPLPEPYLPYRKGE